MDAFSVASLTAVCNTLSHRALSTTVELDDILAHGIITIPVSQTLESLVAKFQQFKQNVEHLRETLNKSHPISDELQHILSESLPNCDGAVAVASKQIKRIGPETPTEAINLGTLSIYADLLDSYSGLFTFTAKLLSLHQHEQQAAKLNTPESQDLLVKAERSAQLLKQSPDILVDADGMAYSPSKMPAPSAPTPISAADDLPPSFEEAIASSSSGSRPTQPGSSRGESSSSSSQGGFMASLTSGFKAITAAMRPKPEPFVVALCEAAARGDIPQIKGFISSGANINGRNEDGYTALICATVAEQVEAARYLLNAGADHNVKDSGKKGRPPFFHAIEQNSEPLIELYLSRGVDVNERNIYGQPFFVDVINSGQVDAIRLLLKRGADPNTRDITGNPIVVLALKKGNLPLVKLLLSRGADVNATDVMTGQHMMVVAFKNGREDIVNVLLSHGADANARTNSGTPLVVEALKKNNIAFVKTLLERGVSANSQDIMGVKLLSLTVKNTAISEAEKESLVKMLLSHGANPNEIDSWGQPSVMTHVMSMNNAKMAKMFLEHGGNANTKLPNGDTFLLNAIDKSSWDQVKTLLRHGANPNDSDKAGRTPLITALHRGESDIVKLLIQHGADVNKLGSISPIAFVRAMRDSETEQLLRQHGAIVPAADPEPRSRPRAKPERAQSPPPGYNE